MKKMFTSNGLSLIVRFAIVSTFVGVLLSGFVLAQCSISGIGNINGNVNYGDPINWANPNRVTVSDDLYARAKLDSGETTKYLMVADFNYALAPGATILGIEVKVEVHEDLNTNAADASIRLMKMGAPSGADRAGSGIYETKDTVNVYGGSTDLWGTTWTPADINDIGFGVLVSVTRNGGPVSQYVYIDMIEVTIYYTGGGCILPIQLSNFSGERQMENSVSLNWSTATATENSLFNIERSTDGSNFSTIGSVDGSGITGQSADFHFVDANAPQTFTYYRLAQLDAEGQLNYSEVVKVAGTNAGGLSINVWPNPCEGRINVAADTENAIVTLTDLSGAEMRHLKMGNLNEAGAIDVADLARGMYILRVTDGNQSAVQKLVLK